MQIEPIFVVVDDSDSDREFIEERVKAAYPQAKIFSAIHPWEIAARLAKPQPEDTVAQEILNRRTPLVVLSDGKMNQIGLEANIFDRDTFIRRLFKTRDRSQNPSTYNDAAGTLKALNEHSKQLGPVLVVNVSGKNDTQDIGQQLELQQRPGEPINFVASTNKFHLSETDFKSMVAHLGKWMQASAPQS